MSTELEGLSDALYERLPSLFPEETEGFGRNLCKALMGMLQGLDVIVADTATKPGWSVIMDPEECPAAWLPWCAQLYGVTLPVGITVAEQRERINAPPQEARGTAHALETEVKFSLEGSKNIFIEERAEGFAYRLVITTLTSQTPSTAKTRAAIASQKPAGIKLHYEVITSPIWDEGTKAWNAITPEWTNVLIGEV